METTAKKNKVSGLLITILFHGGLLAILLLFGFKVQIPPPPEQGILVNFGTTETGSGLQEPSVNKEQQTSLQNNEEENLTQDFEQAPEIKKQNQIKNQTTNNQTQTQAQTQQQQVNQNALFPGNQQNNSSNEGENGENGNQGNPNGDPNANSHQGSPDGGGNSYSLGGRGLKGSLPKPTYPGNEQGKVVVEIFVDRNGVVTKATAGTKGSTLLSKNYLDAAYKAALLAKFDANPDAPEIQKGSITYRFSLQ